MERAGAERVQQAHGLGAPHDPRGQRGHLALEHEGEVADTNLGVPEGHEVVAVEETVLPHVRVRGGLQPLGRRGEEAAQGGSIRRLQAVLRVAIHGRPVALAGSTEGLGGAPPGGGVRGRERCVPGLERRHDVIEELPCSGGERERLGRLEHGGEDLRVTEHRAGGDDRGAGAHQGVVGVVPLWPLGVHPDPGARHQVGELGQEGDQQLLLKGRANEPSVGVVDELAVGALEVHALARDPGAVVVVVDGRLRIADEVVEAADPIGDVGVDEDGPAEEPGHAAWVVLLEPLDEAGEVDDLVVAPVADVRPGVVRVVHLPVEAFARDAVRVVPVGRARVQEAHDERLQVGRVGEAQGLPVLEDVPPVPLVAEGQLALLSAYVDGERVPRAARVSVPAAEGEGQELSQVTLEIRVDSGVFEELAHGPLVGPARDAVGVAREDGRGDRGQVVDEGRARLACPEGEQAAPHGVVEGVGGVPSVLGVARGALHAVGVREELKERLAALADPVQDLLRGVRGLQLPGEEALHVVGAPVDLQGHDPGRTGAWLQLEGLLDEERAALPADEVLLFQGVPAAERSLLLGAEQPRPGGGAPGAGGGQALAGLGAVHRDGAEAEERDAVGELGEPVGVHEDAVGVHHRLLDGGGHHVEHAVEHLEAPRGLAGVGHADRADDPVLLTARPALADREAEGVVVFDEGERAPEGAALQILRDVEDAGAALGERLPDRPVRQANDRRAAHGPLGVVDSIHGAVGEERLVHVAPPGREGAPAGDEAPVIRARGERREERRHAIRAANARPAEAAVGDLVAGGVAGDEVSRDRSAVRGERAHRFSRTRT